MQQRQPQSSPNNFQQYPMTPMEFSTLPGVLQLAFADLGSLSIYLSICLSVYLSSDRSRLETNHNREQCSHFRVLFSAGFCAIFSRLLVCFTVKPPSAQKLPSFAMEICCGKLWVWSDYPFLYINQNLPRGNNCNAIRMHGRPSQCKQHSLRSQWANCWTTPEHGIMTNSRANCYKCPVTQNLYESKLDPESCLHFQSFSSTFAPSNFRERKTFSWDYA